MRSNWRTRLSVAVTVALTLGGVRVRAADVSVGASPRTVLMAFRTFSIRNASVESSRPEFDNPIFVHALTTTIREGLLARGLEETASGADLIVDVTFVNEDATAAGSRPRNPRRSTRGTLLIDLRTPGGTEPVWRGTYRDEQATGSQLGTGVLRGARKLIEKYPRRQRP